MIRLAGHVARMGTGEMRRRFWLGDMLERDNVEDLNVDGRIILEGSSRNGEGKHGLNFFGPEYGQVAGVCQRGDEHSGSIIYGEFFD